MPVRFTGPRNKSEVRMRGHRPPAAQLGSHQIVSSRPYRMGPGSSQWVMNSRAMLPIGMLLAVSGAV